MYAAVISLHEIVVGVVLPSVCVPTLRTPVTVEWWKRTKLLGLRKARKMIMEALGVNGTTVIEACCWVSLLLRLVAIYAALKLGLCS